MLTSKQCSQLLKYLLEKKQGILPMRIRFTPYSSISSCCPSVFSHCFLGHFGPLQCRTIIVLSSGRELRDEGDDTTRQDEVRSAEYLGYPRWIESLMQDLSSQAIHPLSKKFERGESLSVGHPIAGISGKLVKGICDIYQQTNCSITTKMFMGFYSRLGGAYKSNTNVSIFPIGYRDHEGVSRTSGVCLVPPCHARGAGDKMAFYTIEAFSKEPRANAYVEAMYKGEILNFNHIQVGARRNSVFKEDPPYGSFLHSSLFVIANTLGELCLQNAAEEGEEPTRELTESIIRTHQFWISERITESTLMGILGRSPEEGAIALLRKVYLILYALNKGKAAFTYDIKGLCDKINECTLSNPLEMYWVVSFIRSIRHFVHRQSIGQLEVNPNA